MRDRDEARARAQATYSALDMMPVVSNGPVLPLTSLPCCQLQRVSELSLGEVKLEYSPEEEERSSFVEKMSEEQFGDIAERREEIKNDLDAAYRAVDIALAGLELGGKRRPEGPYMSEQKFSLARSTNSQKLEAKERSTNRTMDRMGPEDGQLGASPEALNEPEQLRSLHFRVQQIGQGKAFHSVQSAPPPIGGCSDFLGPPNVLNADRCSRHDRETEVPALGDHSHMELSIWDGFGYSSQREDGIGYTTEYIQGLPWQEKAFKDLNTNCGIRRSVSDAIGLRTGVQSGLTPFQVGSCVEFESNAFQCFPQVEIDQSAASIGLGHSMKLDTEDGREFILPDSLDSLDDGDGTWEVDFLPNVYAHGNAADPKIKSEQAMLLAITGILKCAVEGNLAHKDVLSDLYFLIVAVRRHLEEYQNLTPDAAETLLLICSALPTACKCARFDGDVINSLKRFMEVISLGHPLLHGQCGCLNGYDPVSHLEPKQHSEVQHLLRRIHRKLTGGTTSTGVQHVARALFDAVGEKNSFQSSTSCLDYDSHGSSLKWLGLSPFAAQSAAAGSQSPGSSDGDANSAASALSGLANNGHDGDAFEEYAAAVAHAVLPVDGVDQMNC